MGKFIYALKLLLNMKIDIVLPNNNENAFVVMAKRLGFDGLIFLYDKYPSTDCAIKDFKCWKGCVAKNVQQLQKLKKFDFIFSKSGRAFFENKKIHFIYGVETDSGKDATHYRATGLNQVLCKLAKDTNKTLCISFNDLLKARRRELLVGRMVQNLRFYKKFKVKVQIASFATKPFEMRAPRDLVAFGITLGMSPGDAKKSILKQKNI